MGVIRGLQVPKHILVVEDETSIREMTKIALQREGYRVSEAEDTKTAVLVLESDPADLALVDWMLPDRSGVELIRALRKDELTRRMPIIMLTAKTDEQDVSTGLDAGADDYVSKPFSPRELNARIRAQLRRSDDFGALSIIQRGPIILDTTTMRLSVDNNPVSLAHTEFKLLEFLLANAERVYSRAQLLDHVWGRTADIEERTVDVHILRLRKSLKPYKADRFIDTVRGAGYRFTEQLEPSPDD